MPPVLNQTNSQSINNKIKATAPQKENPITNPWAKEFFL